MNSTSSSSGRGPRSGNRIARVAGVAHAQTRAKIIDQERGRPSALVPDSSLGAPAPRAGGRPFLVSRSVKPSGNLRQSGVISSGRSRTAAGTLDPLSLVGLRRRAAISAVPVGLGGLGKFGSCLPLFYQEMTAGRCGIPCCHWTKRPRAPCRPSPSLDPRRPIPYLPLRAFALAFSLSLNASPCLTRNERRRLAASGPPRPRGHITGLTRGFVAAVASALAMDLEPSSRRDICELQLRGSDMTLLYGGTETAASASSASETNRPPSRGARRTALGRPARRGLQNTLIRTHMWPASSRPHRRSPRACRPPTSRLEPGNGKECPALRQEPAPPCDSRRVVPAPRR